MQWEKVTIAGIGLLGGSLGLALKQRGLSRSVVGLVRRAEVAAECEGLGLVDRATTDAAEAFRAADLVVLCTPLAQMPPLATRMQGALKRGALVTDVGSVKACVVDEIEPIVAAAGGRFVGSHPMAGSEQIGFRAARADLFQNALCAVTPSGRSSPEAIERIEEFWLAVGARILRISPQEHDGLVSRSSHLVHVLASALAQFVLNPALPPEQRLLCANGFRDTTRVASGSPEMWRDIALANRRHLTQALDDFVGDLRKVRDALEHNDAAGLEQFFVMAKERRDRWKKESAGEHSAE